MSDRFSLDNLAADASDNAFFFGHHLRLYATRRTLTNAGLAAWLGVSPEVLQRVRLCRTPADREQAKQIADAFGVAVEKVAEVMGW
ncbi:hypothetical protein R5W24_004422 [Gemmata sp. JC717]|uniref:hypothetical protein n=1 Tax=Gemmata algarum TaxID=2975278 RepID=UPI0021BA890F|nr:hypothetical protein [Gemmata algarum]MDY3555281.1 hypothetical protein [Gemmata algarum]